MNFLECIFFSCQYIRHMVLQSAILSVLNGLPQVGYCLTTGLEAGCDCKLEIMDPFPICELFVCTSTTSGTLL